MAAINPDGAQVSLRVDAENRLLVSGPAGGDASAANQVIQSAKLDQLHTDMGSPGATPPAIAGSGLIGWLRGVIDKLSSLLTVRIYGTDSGGVDRPILVGPLGRPIIAMPAPIEVRNALGALAANTTTFTDPPIDLGPAATRQHTLLMLTKTGVASAGEALNIKWSDDNINWVFVSPSPLGSTSSSSSYSSASAGSTCTQGRPMGRYARGFYTNGSTPQTDLQLALTAIAGV